MRPRPKPQRLTGPSRMLNVAGLPLTVVSDAETADAVVVMPDTFDSPFTDNLRGICSSCGKAVIFRPHVPKSVPKLCINCAGPFMAPPAGTA